MSAVSQANVGHLARTNCLDIKSHCYIVTYPAYSQCQSLVWKIVDIPGRCETVIYAGLHHGDIEICTRSANSELTTLPIQNLLKIFVVIPAIFPQRTG